MRLSVVLAAVAVLSSTGVGLAQETPSPAPAVAPDDPGVQARAAAKANIARMQVRPAWTGGPIPRLTDALKEKGHHGVVVILGVVSVDGRLVSAVVSKSSGSPELDALALEASKAVEFSPAKDVSGSPLAVTINFPMEFYNYKSDEPGGGGVRYTCRQFARDMDWWRAAHPNAKWGDHEFFTMMLGIGFIGNLYGIGKPSSVADFERRWEAAIKTCRAKPDKRFVEVLQPEGSIAEAQSKASTR